MDNYSHNDESQKGGAGRFVAGLLLGGLAGAATMLLLAPQSGEETRAQIQQRSRELRDQTNEALAQARTKAGELKETAQEKAVDLKRQGKEKLVEQMDRVSERVTSAVESGKKAIQGSESKQKS
jgi:gas vesicle protein